MKLRHAFLALFACTVSLSSLAEQTVPAFYSAGATVGTVVDPAGRPVEGAVVVAQWVLEAEDGSGRVGPLVVREATTDASGRFRIEGWDAVARPVKGRLDRLDPEVVILKSGGLFWTGSNYGLADPGERVGLDRRDSLRNGSTIRLQSVKVGANDMERQSPVYGVWAALHRVIKSNDCKWTQIPRALASLEKDFARVGRASTEIRGTDFLSRGDCGSLTQFRTAYEDARDRSP